jgi:putative phage-type endonuclease
MIGSTHATVIADQKNEQQWLKARRGLLGASDVASVLGLSPWSPAVETWAKKTSRYEETPDDVSEPMEIGKEIEPWLLRALEIRTRCDVRPAGQLLQSVKWPWLGATLDGIIQPRPHTVLAPFMGTLGAVEVKAAGGSFADEWVNTGDDASGFVPAHYLPQIDCQLAVTGAPFSVFGALLGGRGFRYRWCVVPRNEARIAELVERTGEWWAKHVEADVPPEPDGSERADEIIARLYPEHGGIIRLDDAAATTWDQLQELKAEIRERTKKADLLSQKLKMEIGTASNGELPDGRVLRLATIQRKAFSVEASSYRKLSMAK